MGKNKQLRKRIEGQLRNITKYQAKIQRENAKLNPNMVLIRK
jgi:hypothetical protein